MQKLIFSFALLTLFFSSCKKDPDPVIEDTHDFTLYANYENPPAGSPVLTVDQVQSSKEINIEATPTITQQGGRINFNYAAVTLKLGKTVYAIDKITTERKNGTSWIVDDENTLTYTFSKSLDIVMVLDVSSSLGANLASLKDNAKTMVSKVLTDNPSARINIIKFSRGSVASGFSSNISTLTGFINAESTFNSPDIGAYVLEGKSETALYESINSAIQLLSSSSARGKGILTFTDGVSNYQFDPQYSNATSVISQLNNLDIASYTIGFVGNQGGVDQSTLQQIAVNGDFSFPKNTAELSDVFKRFSNSVAAVYDLIYNTNNAKFNDKIEYRFLFDATKISG